MTDMPGPNETRLNLIDGVEYITLRADDFRAKVGRLTHLHNLDHSLADQREAEVERLRADLAIYGDHLSSCWLRQTPPIEVVGRSRCNCGYFKAVGEGLDRDKVG